MNTRYSISPTSRGCTHRARPRLVLRTGQAPHELDPAFVDDEVRRTSPVALAPTDAPGVGLPEDLLDADSVAIVFDEVEGLAFYRDFGRIDALFADPGPAPDRADLARLREYLGDDPVPPLAIRRLVQRHPHNADAVFRALLRKPEFSWTRDGEALLLAGARSPTSRASRGPA